MNIEKSDKINMDDMIADTAKSLFEQRRSIQKKVDIESPYVHSKNIEISDEMLVLAISRISENTPTPIPDNSKILKIEWNADKQCAKIMLYHPDFNGEKHE